MAHFVGDDCQPNGHRDEPGIDLAEHLDREERAFLEASLATLARDEAAQKQLKEQVDPIRARLKAYHDRHPDEVIMDAERGLVANFVESNKGDEVDLIALVDTPNAAETLVSMARAGILSARVTPLKALRGKAAWADHALHHTNSSGVKVSLSIERIEQ